MESKKTEKLGPGKYRETKTYNSGAKRVEVYKQGLILRDTQSVKHITAPKKSR